MNENQLTTERELTAVASRFIPATTPPKKESAYKKKMRRLREEKEEEERQKRQELNNTNALFANASSTLVTPVKKNYREEPNIFTPGEYNPISHNLVEMPPTPMLDTSSQKLNFETDLFDIDIDKNDEIFKSEEKGGRIRKSRKLRKSSKKSRKSRRKTTRKVRRHSRRH
jgi:hypothetical protein